MPLRTCLVPLAVLLLTAASAPAQEAGTLRGRVTYGDSGEPVHGAVILVLGPGRTVTTDADGRFEVANLRPGSYEVLAQREHLSTERQTVTVSGAAVAQIEFRLELEPVHEQLTVTATAAGSTTTFEAFNSIHGIDAFSITQAAAPTLGHLVEQTPGVDLRTFGPASARPIIRGFDGDRVLILQDGLRTGDLSSQSGDHGTTIDPGALDRVEVVRGPATLFYGSNAVGGLIHALTPQEAFRRSPFAGLRGQILTDAGTATGQAGANANLQYGNGRWMLWAGGGSRRTGDYGTPEGTVEHSASRLSNGRVGLGLTGRRAFFSVGYDIEDGRYGVPFAGAFHAHGAEDHDDGDPGADPHDSGEDELDIDLRPRRESLRLDVGTRSVESRFVESARVAVSHLRWRHDEIEIEDGIETLGTRFDNRSVIVRGELEQRGVGPLTGRVGVSAEFRDYRAEGEEALAGPTTQRNVAAFAYEEIDLGRARLMVGGRVDRTAFDTDVREAVHLHVYGHDDEEIEIDVPATRDRQFTGGSASAGIHLGLTPASAVVATVTRSYRAPALEELYNLGPHTGNLAFEIGSPDLEREATVGLDVSLRHRSPRLRGEFNTFVYSIDNFVFPDVQPEQTIDGLRATYFRQSDSRFAGIDAHGSVRAHDSVWVNVGLGYVNARLTTLDEYVPRIPPVHARVSADISSGGLTITPEIAWAGRQVRVFRDELATEGYQLFNLTGAIVLPRPHFAHIVSISGRNLTNALYRRHTSFIKDLAPEVGRTVTFSYGVRFF